MEEIRLATSQVWKLVNNGMKQQYVSLLEGIPSIFSHPTNKTAKTLKVCTFPGHSDPPMLSGDRLTWRPAIIAGRKRGQMGVHSGKLT